MRSHVLDQYLSVHFWTLPMPETLTLVLVAYATGFFSAIVLLRG